MRHGVAPVQHAARGAADCGGVGEDLLHPRVGLERLAVLDANGSQLSGEFHVVTGGRFLLHVFVDHFEEAEVAGRNRVE